MPLSLLTGRRRGRRGRRSGQRRRKRRGRNMRRRRRRGRSKLHKKLVITTLAVQTGLWLLQILQLLPSLLLQEHPLKRSSTSSIS
eukprot:18598_6